jgi:hypothetical protein
MHCIGAYADDTGEYKLICNNDTIELHCWNTRTEEWDIIDYYQGNCLCSKLADEIKEVNERCATVQYVEQLS